MDTPTDIVNNILTRNDYQIYHIIDNKNVPWFYVPDCAKLFHFNNFNSAIRKYVKNSDKTRFNKLRKYTKGMPLSYATGNPNALYISEPGLYTLFLFDKKSSARNWVTSSVLPSIFNSGSYHITK